MIHIMNATWVMNCEEMRPFLPEKSCLWRWRFQHLFGPRKRRSSKGVGFNDWELKWYFIDLYWELVTTIIIICRWNMKMRKHYVKRIRWWKNREGFHSNSRYLAFRMFDAHRIAAKQTSSEDSSVPACELELVELAALAWKKDEEEGEEEERRRRRLSWTGAKRHEWQQARIMGINGHYMAL